MPERNLITFVVTSVALLAIVVGARLMVGAKAGLPIANADESPASDCYLSTDNRTTLDQLIFHHQLENVAPQLQNADVVFAGNSRSLCAFPAETCDDYFHGLSLNWYHAGFPAENNVFTEHILQTFDARPKVIVVNADDFFTGTMSTIARRSVDQTSFGANKQYWESRLSFRMRHRLHQWLPHAPTMFFARESMIVHRSLTNGAWLVNEAQGSPTDVDVETSDEIVTEDCVQIALKFQKLIRERGGELVLTYVPTAVNKRVRAEQIATRLGCRFISPKVDGLRTIDGSHLDQVSAKRFSTAFLKQLGPVRIASH